MPCTVFAENMGFFHKGSGGKGVAPIDVCMTPPPPPAGPIPVPYVNMAMASDLTSGSTSVKIDGEPTALEDASKISTSSGNEPGSQPPKGLVTATNKGKAAFTIWSFTVKVEGKGVCRHGDAMLQNMNSPPNCINPTALTNFKATLKSNLGKPCEPYDRDKHTPPINAAQDKKVHGKKCWECARELRASKGKSSLTKGGRFLSTEKEYKTRGGGSFVNRDRDAMTPDHQPPLNVAWALGGCHMPKPPPADPSGFMKHFGSPKAVKPHCRNHSNSQGSQATAYANRIIARRA